jgi:hypothetical protein
VILSIVCRPATLLLVPEKTPYLFKNANSFYNFVSLLRDSQQTPVFSHKFSQYFIFYILIFLLPTYMPQSCSTEQYSIYCSSLHHRTSLSVDEPLLYAKTQVVPASVRTSVRLLFRTTVHPRRTPFLNFLLCSFYSMAFQEASSAGASYEIIFSPEFRLSTQAQIFTYGAVPYSLLL